MGIEGAVLGFDSLVGASALT